jgi:hypothetical protein
LAQAQQRIAELEGELKEARFHSSLNRGRLTAVEGPASPWPSSHAHVLAPQAFEAFVRDTLVSEDLAQDVEFECDEYPCVAVARMPLDDPMQIQTKMQQIQDRLQRAGETLEDDLGMSLEISVTSGEGDQGATAYLGYALFPKNAEAELGTRTEYRVDTLMKDAANDDGGQVLGSGSGGH